MSRQLLESLAGSSSRLLAQWLETAPREPRIAWYPSCGADFRDIVYLSAAFSRSDPPLRAEPPPPDLFIHTDYMATIFDRFAPGGHLYRGRNSELTVIRHEALPAVRLPVSGCSAEFPDAAKEPGRVDFMQVCFATSTLGTIEAPLLFISAENAAFCAELLLPSRSRVSHVVQVRYGSGFGGAACAPSWLLNVLPRLQTEVFISDGHHRSPDPRLEALFREMPELEGPCDDAGLQCIRTLPEARWSNHGDVDWLVVPSPTTHQSAQFEAASPRGP